MIFRTFSARFDYFLLTRGDALRYAQRLPLAIILRAFGASLRSALAPGYHISRLWRLAQRSASPWLSYCAPLAPGRLQALGSPGDGDDVPRFVGDGFAVYKTGEPFQRREASRGQPGGHFLDQEITVRLRLS